MRHTSGRAALVLSVSIACMALHLVLASAAELEQITIQFRWNHQFQFAGYYAAREKGFFAEEGLEVVLRERSWDASPVEDVLSGNAEYGIADASLLIDRSLGRPVVLLAQIFQHAPGVLLTLSDSGITSPADLEGKRVMTVSDDAGVQAMLLNELGDLSKIEISEHQGSFDAFTSGEVDAMAGYLSNEPFLLRQQGFSLYIMDPRDYGIDQYGDNFFTTEDEIRDHPDRVDRVIRAVIRGWEYAFQHPDEIIDLILDAYAPERTREHLDFEAKMTEMLVLPDLVPIGHVSPERFERVAETFARLGLMTEGEVPSGFIYHASRSNRQGVPLTPDEMAWLEEHSAIPMVVETDVAPYAYVNEEGEFVGVLADVCTQLEALLGISFDYETVDRSQMKHLLVDGQYQVVSGLELWDAELLEPYVETQEILFMPYGLFAGSEGISDEEEGGNGAKRRIAIRSDWVLDHPALESLRPCEFVTGETVVDCINLVLQGDADAVFDIASVVTNLLTRHLIRDLRLVQVFNRGHSLSIRVRDDWPQLLSALNKALSTITSNARIALLEEWNAYLEDPGYRLLSLSFSEEERQWLLEHPEIRVGSDPSWAPIEFRTEDGVYQGVAIDFLRAVEELLGIQFKIASDLSRPELIEQVKARNVDVLSSLAMTSERSEYLTFTSPYIGLPIDIFTRDDVAYVASPADLVGKRVAVVSGYAIEEWLAEQYPGIELVPASTTIEALEQLQDGDVFAFIGDLVTTGHYLGQLKATDIKVVGDTAYEYKQAMAVRSDWPVLASILQKALDVIPASQRNEIQRSWLAVSFEHGFDYRRFWQVLATALVIIGLVTSGFLYWNRRLAREIRARRAAERLRLLSARTTEIEEDERKRIARDLHDLVGQKITALGIALQRLSSRTTNSEAEAILTDAQVQLKETAEHVHGVMSDLRPAVLDDYGIVSAIRWYAAEFSERTGLQVVVRGEDPEAPPNANAVNAIYRATQEALTNAKKHAKATSVDISVEHAESMTHVIIADDGTGFDTTRIGHPGPGNGWGLIGMRERIALAGGVLHIDSAPGKGTKIHMEVPRSQFA